MTTSGEQPTNEAPKRKMRSFDSALPLSLLRARAATAQKFKVHTDAVGLTQPQWQVIRALGDGEALDVGTIAARCALHQPSVSRLLKSLIDRELVQMLPGDDNRRRKITLTAHGVDLFERVGTISEAVYDDIERAYGREELAQLVRMLHRLREVVEAMPALPLADPEAGEELE